MAVDGTFSMSVNTPMGTQNAKLILKTDGDSLSGNVSGPRGEQSISGGTVSGDNAAWTTEASGPMGQMKLDFRATVSGDEISGTVQLGSYGSADFRGTRA